MTSAVMRRGVKWTWGCSMNGRLDGHEDGAEAHLKNGEWLEGNARRDMAQGDAVKCESDGAAEGEDVAEVHGREIGKHCGEWRCVRGALGEVRKRMPMNASAAPRNAFQRGARAPGGRSAGTMEKSGTRTTTSPVMNADLEGVVRTRPMVWNW